MIISFCSLASLSCFAIATTQTGTAKDDIAVLGIVLLALAWVMLATDVMRIFRDRPKPMTRDDCQKTCAELVAEQHEREKDVPL